MTYDEVLNEIHEEGMCKYDPIPIDKMSDFINMYSLANTDTVYKLLEEIENKPTVLAIFIKRIKAFNLVDKIDLNCCLVLDIYDIDNPGVTVLYVIILLNYYDKFNIKITYDIVNTEIFPDGFPNKEMCFHIIDNYVKTNKLKYSEIY